MDCDVLTAIYALALFRQRLGENDFNPFVMSLPRYDHSLFHHIRSICELTQKWHSYTLNLECEGLPQSMSLLISFFSLIRVHYQQSPVFR